MISTAEFSAKQDRDNKIARLKQISGLWDQFPGRAPGGTGLTGLGANDSRGWSDVLNQQTEAQNILNELGGKGPAQVRSAPLREQHSTNEGVDPLGAAAAENYAENPLWWLMGDNNGSGDDRSQLSRLPASMRGLFAAAK